MPRVTFLNEAVVVDAEVGKSIREIADAAGVSLFAGFWSRYHCSGSGTCPGNGCRVWVTELSSKAVSERSFWERLRPTHKGTIRLACQARIHGDIEVRTQPGALEAKPSTRWDPEPGPARWKERLGGTEGAEKIVATKE